MEEILAESVRAATPWQRFKTNRYIYIALALLMATISIDYATTLNINHALGDWFYVLPVAALVLGSLPLVKDWNLFRYKYLVASLAQALASIFIIFFTDGFGPYFQILILLLFLTIYWFGVSGLVIGLVAQYITLVTAAWHQYGSLSAEVGYKLIVYAMVLVTLGILFERVSLRHRLKDTDATHLLQTVSFERSRLLSLINSMADAVLATNRHGQVVLYNGAVLDLLNTNLSIAGKRLSEVVQLKNEKDEDVDLLLTATKTDAIMKREDLYFISSDNQKVQLYIDLAPIRTTTSDEDGGFIMLLRDITRQKSLDEERSEFISVTSHELRTPIAIAEANISTALLPQMVTGMSKQAQDLLNQAHAQVMFLANLVNDLTTLARAERDDLPIETDELKLKELLAELVANYQAEAAAKKLTISLASNIAEGSIWTSGLYVREVLQNFITNSIKYTNKGGITLAAAQSGDGVVFCVADTGVGISASDQKKIFQKFYRVEDYRTRQTRGTGLGLYITVKLAQKVKGRVWLKSQLNKGSQFYLSVPSLAPAALKVAPVDKG